LSDQYGIIYVSPDGNYDSWYVDSNLKKESKYYTFVSKELVDYIDSNFSTYKAKEHRAITGLSMGGFGAFYIGIKNQDVFGNIGSMSGGMNPEQYKGNWGIEKVINSDWNEYNIKDIAHKLIGTKSNLIIDCGVDDFFIELPIGKIGDDLRRIELSEENGGKSAKTHIKVLERNREKNITFLEARLYTGRTHQIRAHLSLIGHPLVGDELYGGDMNLAKRQMLHAYKLEFQNPKTLENLKVEIEIPVDMKEVLK